MVNETVTILRCYDNDFVGKKALVIFDLGDGYLECFSEDGHTVIVSQDDVTLTEQKIKGRQNENNPAS